MQNRLMKFLSWFMIIVLLFQWSSVWALTAAQRQAEARQAQKEQTIAKLERLFDALEEAVKEIPRDTFDPQAIVDKVGKDPIALYEWVRDNTYLVPYRGALRGPIGVLMDRLGNSLDRALLLHKLLTLAGHEVRLARTSLTEEQAEMLLNKARPIPPEGPFPVIQQSPQTLDEYIIKQAEKFNLDATELQQIAGRLTYQQQYLAEELAQQVADQTEALLELIGEPESDTSKEDHNKAIKALQDHWWVQYKDSSGWTVVDPALPQDKILNTFSNNIETLQPEAIDKSLQHLVTIRVLIERLEEGEPWEEKVFEYTLRPSELFGKRIHLKHLPLNWPKNLDLFTVENPSERLKEEVSKEKEWLPVLTIGSETITQYSFTDTGQVKKEPGKKDESVYDATRSLWGGFMNSMSGEEIQEKNKNTQLIAEWIEYETRLPGEASQKNRRNVFNLLKQSERQRDTFNVFKISEADRINRGLALLGELDILMQTSNLHPNYIAYLTGSRLLENRKQLIHSLRDSNSIEDFFKNLQEVTPLPGLNYQYILLRQQQYSHNTIYLARPNIVTFLRNLLTGKEDKLVSSVGIDIISNDVEVKGGSNRQRFNARVHQGVLDTLSENMSVKSIGKVSKNTAEMFMRSETQKIKWMTLRTIEGLKAIQQHLNDIVFERLETDLQDGYILIAPEQAMNIDGRGVFGWWKIDPKRGQTIGMMDGRGESTTEYLILLTFKGIFISKCALESPLVTSYPGHPEKRKEQAQMTLICFGVSLISFVSLLASTHIFSWLIIVAEFIEVGIEELYDSSEEYGFRPWTEEEYEEFRKWERRYDKK